MIPTLTVTVAGGAAVLIIAALLWRIRKLERTLDGAKAVNRVLSGNWREIPVYVSQTGELMCSGFNCPTRGHIAWPQQRLVLHQVVQGFHYHHREHHGAQR